MAKVNTLLKLIDYQKQHPNASDSEISEGLGLSERHIRRCRQEVNLLKEKLSDDDLNRNQIAFLIAELDRTNSYHQLIIRQLQKRLGAPYNGSLRLARKGENGPLQFLNIGELIPKETYSPGELPPSLSYWFINLCYDPLLMCYRNGEIVPRLATGCEPIAGFREWMITLRPDRCWSDGKPITVEEVCQALSMSRLAPTLVEIKRDSSTQLRISLSKADPTFPFRLRGIFVRPSHATTPYQVISGAYRLKRCRKNTKTYHLERNPNDSIERETNVDWLTITRFALPANALKSIESGKIDLLPLRALQSLHQIGCKFSPQQCPFFEDNYYLLFLNRYHGILRDRANCQTLRQGIDYQTIALYLNPEQSFDVDSLSVSSPLHLRIAYAGRDARHLAYLIGKWVKSSVISPSPIPDLLQETVDALVTQTFFGLGYNRLALYFHSEGESNFFGYANPEVDELLTRLNRTVDMAKRQTMGQQILSLLEADFAIIRLHPCFQYFLSPLAIQFDDQLTGVADLIQNISDLLVSRLPLADSETQKS